VENDIETTLYTLLTDLLALIFVALLDPFYSRFNEEFLELFLFPHDSKYFRVKATIKCRNAHSCHKRKQTHSNS